MKWMCPLCIGLCGLLSLLPASALAAATVAPDLTAYTVPVAPWTFPEEPTRGIAPEYLRFLFDAAQINIRLDTLPYLRVINSLRDGSNAAAILAPDPERDGFALRLCDITTIRAGLLYKKSRFKTLTLDKLSGLSIGIQHGTHTLDKLLQVPNIRRELIESVDQGLKMLEMDHLDATFLSNPGSLGVMRSHGFSPEDYGWLEVEELPVVVYISRKSALASDEAALKRLKNVCEGSAKPVMQKLMRAYR